MFPPSSPGLCWLCPVSGGDECHWFCLDNQRRLRRKAPRKNGWTCRGHVSYVLSCSAPNFNSFFENLTHAPKAPTIILKQPIPACATKYSPDLPVLSEHCYKIIFKHTARLLLNSWSLLEKTLLQCHAQCHAKVYTLKSLGLPLNHRATGLLRVNFKSLIFSSFGRTDGHNYLGTTFSRG